MTWTLAEVIAPLSEGAFVDLLATRRLAHLPGDNPDRFGPLFSWDRLRSHFAAGNKSCEGLFVTRRHETVPRLFYTDKNGLDLAKFLKLVDGESSLVVRKANRFSPQLDQLVTHIREHLSEQVNAAVVTTMGEGGALKTHFDRCDVLVLQCEGRKRWLVYDEPYLDPIGTTETDCGNESAEVIFDQALAPGDALFVPAGYRHKCENQAGRSLHIAIMLLPTCGQHVLSALAHRLAADPAFRRPVGRTLDPARRQVELEEMKDALIRVITDTPTANLVSAHLDEEAAY